MQNQSLEQYPSNNQGPLIGFFGYGPLVAFHPINRMSFCLSFNECLLIMNNRMDEADAIYRKRCFLDFKLSKRNIFFAKEVLDALPKIESNLHSYLRPYQYPRE